MPKTLCPGRFMFHKSEVYVMGAAFFDRYEQLCKSRNESPNSVAKILGASSGSVTAWKKGTAPRNATLLKMADFFGVSVGYLLGTEEREMLPSIPSESNVIKIAGRDGSYEERILTDSQMKALRAILDQMPDASGDL